MLERPISGKQVSETAAANANSMSDVELVERVKAGRTEAYAQLVTKYQDRVFNTCWRICGHVEDARDVTQDAFVKAFESIHTFRQESGFYTWLFRIAVNLALSQRRNKARRRTVSIDSDMATAGTQAAELARSARARAADNANPKARDAELQAVVARALHALDDDHRAVIVLRDMEGLDYRRIGEILGVAPGTVKSRLHRARMAIREALLPVMAKHS